MTKVQDIGTIVNRGASTASLIINENGIIVSFNDKLKTIFGEIETGRPFAEKLSIKNSQLFERLILSAKNQNTSIKDTLEIKQSDDEVREIEVFVTPFLNEEDNLYFVSFQEKRIDIYYDGEKNNISLLAKNTEEIIKDERLLKLIEMIQSEFPFTIIGRSRIKKTIDELRDPFWIKNPEGEFILVNKAFSKSVGVREIRIEGKKNEEILPSYISKLFSEIEEYIAASLNAVAVSGSITAIFNPDGKNEMVQLPIYDIDQKIVAIVGFTQAAESKSEKKPGNTQTDMIIDNFAEPLIIFNEKNVCSQINRKALKFFGFDSYENAAGYPPEKIFPDEFYSKVKFFMQNKDDVGEMEINHGFKKDEEKYDVLVKKIYDDNNQFNGTYFLFRITDLKKMEKMLREKMHDLIMQNSPEPMFIYNIENLKFLEVNNAALTLYGYNREEFLKMDLTDLYAPEDIQTLIESAGSGKTGIDFTGPWRHKTRDGKSILVELSKSEIVYNNIKAHLNIVRDVTEEVGKEKQLQLFRAAFDNSDDLIFNTDKDGFITFANSQVAKILGYSKQSLEERPFLSLLSNNDRALINTEVFHSGIKERQTIQVEMKKLSGDLIKVFITATPILDYDGQIDSFNLIIKPIEESAAQTETVVPSAQKGLDSTFLSNLFHEILTPINVIIGFSQEINESLENPSDEQKEAADIIRENKNLLLQIMDNAIEYSAIEQSRIQLSIERVVFIDLLDQLQTNIKKAAKSKSVELAYGKISSSLAFETDKQRFLSAVSILLNFAIQMMPGGKLFLSAYQFDSDSFLVSLKDERSGITEKLHNNLTDLFSKDEDQLKKEFGISRFMIRLGRKLIEILGAELFPLERGGDVIEFGIKFPNILTAEAPEQPEEKVEAPEPEPVKVERETVAAAPAAQAAIAEPQPERVPARQTASQSAETKQTPEPAVDVQPVVVKQPTQPEPAEQPVVVKRQEPILPEEKESKPAPSPVLNKPINELSCLYVEDQVDSQILFKVQMKDFKSIDFANSFEKALPLLKSKKYDFIVMDINLQGEYNGLDALHVIQKLPGFENVPVIAVTAYVLPGDREKFIAAGFQDFISKPVLRDKLIDCLNKLFQPA